MDKTLFIDHVNEGFRYQATEVSQINTSRMHLFDMRDRDTLLKSHGQDSFSSKFPVNYWNIDSRVLILEDSFAFLCVVCFFVKI